MNQLDYRRQDYSRAVTASNIGDMTPETLSLGQRFSSSYFASTMTPLVRPFLLRLHLCLLNLERKGLVRRYDYGTDIREFKLYGDDKTVRDQQAAIFHRATGILPEQQNYTFVKFINVTMPNGMPTCEIWIPERDKPRLFSNTEPGHYTTASIKDIVTMELILKDYEIAAYEHSQLQSKQI